MDILTKFLNGIAYKFPKGYPDRKDPKDVLMLENEIKKMGIPFNFSILTEEVLIFEATDREISSNAKKAIQYFLDNAEFEKHHSDYLQHSILHYYLSCFE